jgi:hypothetical protein
VRQPVVAGSTVTVGGIAGVLWYAVALFEDEV